MSSATKAAAVCGLLAVTLSACGTAAKPEAGSVRAAAKSAQQLNDPRTKHVKCLAQHGIHDVRLESLTVHHYQSFQVGTVPSGPTVEFLATAGAAQNEQIQGQAQGAEVIGAALLYPNAASDKLLNVVESCVAKGVSG